MHRIKLILMFIIYLASIITPLVGGATLYEVDANANFDANSMAINWQQKMVKGFNDTYYAVYTGNGEVYISRSFDNGATWAEWGTLSPGSTTNDWYAAIAIDYDQNLHVVWSGLSGAIQYVQYRKFDVATQTWDAVINLTRSGYNADTPSIYVDGNNKIYVFCNVNSGGMTNRRIAMTTSADNGATWSGTDNVSTDNSYTQGNAFAAIDSDNNVYLMWSGKHVGSAANNQIRFRRYYSSNTTWNAETLNITTTAAQAQVSGMMSINKSDIVHLAWDGYNGGANYQIRYANYNPATNTLSAITEVTNTAFDKRCPGISATWDDRLHISMKSSTGGNPMVNYTYSTDAGATWATPFEISPGTDNYENPCMLSANFPQWNASSGTSYQGIKKCVPTYGCQVFYQNRTPAPDVLTLYDDYSSFYQPNVDGPEFIVSLNVSSSIGTQPSPTQRKVAVSSNGTIYVIHTQNAVTLNVRVSRSLDDGQTWSMIWNTTYWAYDADLCIDSNDTLYVTWADTQLGGVVNTKMAYMTSDGTWSGVQQVSNHPVAGQNQEDIQCLVNSSDAVYFVWYGKWDAYPAVYNIHYKYWYNGAMSTQYNVTDDDTYDQYFMSCEFDSEDTMHLAWIAEANDTYPAVKNIRYANITKNNVISDFQWVTADNLYDKSYPCLAIDLEDTKHIVWNGEHAGSGGATEIFYRNYTKNSNWSATEYITAARTDQTTPSLTCNTSNGLTIFFGGYTNDSLADQRIRVTTRAQGEDWTPIVNLTGINRHMQNPHALYHYYPILEANGSYLHSNMPVSGYTGIFWNETKRVEYYDSGVTFGYSGSPYPWYIFSPDTITKSTVQLKGYVDGVLDADNYDGFYLSTTVPIDKYDYDYNLSAGSGFTTGEYIYYNKTGLTHSTYYYARGWMHNNTEFLYTNTTYFVTSPLDPYGAETVNGTYSINLSWVNPSINDGTLRAICYYNDTAYPTTIGTGALGFNKTTTAATRCYQTISGLDVGTTYYFSIWTYIIASGSPTVHSYSDSYETIVGTTTGGQYNISFLYENTTYHQVKWHYPQALNHTLIVHYANETEYNVFNGTGYVYQESNGDFAKLSKGFCILNLSQTPMYFEFLWNGTTTDYMCHRILIPANGIKNLTFYVLTNKFVYGETTGNLNNSLIRYTTRFVDDTGVFLPSHGFDIYAYVYTYNATGSRLIIHSEYLNSYEQIFPMLLYQKGYFIGISDGNTVYDQLTMVATESVTSGVVIIGETETVSNYSDVHFKYGFSGGVYFNYNDWNNHVSSTDLRIYDYNNKTIESLLYHSNSALDSFNYTYAAGNSSHYYYYNFTFNSSSSSGTEYYAGIIYPTTEYTIPGNKTNIDAMLNLTLGTSPFTDPTTGDYVPWISVVIFAIFVLILCTFSGFNAVVSGISTGAWLVFTGALAMGTNVAVAGVGFFIIAVSILYAWGENKR